VDPLARRSRGPIEEPDAADDEVLRGAALRRREDAEQERCDQGAGPADEPCLSAERAYPFVHSKDSVRRRTTARLTRSASPPKLGRDLAEGGRSRTNDDEGTQVRARSALRAGALRHDPVHAARAAPPDARRGD